MSDNEKTQPPSADGARIDDDVEGHGHGTPRAAGDDDDVEGHRKRRAVDDGSDDTEGHGHGTPRAAGDDDDVEGHYGQLKGPSSRGE